MASLAEGNDEIDKDFIKAVGLPFVVEPEPPEFSMVRKGVNPLPRSVFGRSLLFRNPVH